MFLMKTNGRAFMEYHKYVRFPSGQVAIWFPNIDFICIYVQVGLSSNESHSCAGILMILTKEVRQY